MGTDKRVALRKSVSGLTVSSLVALDNFSILSRRGLLVDASSTGFKLRVHREDLIPKSLRDTLTLDALLGERVLLKIAEMNLEIDGTVARTKLIGKGHYELGIDFSEDAPEYWRECLLDLLPEAGELEDI